MNDDEIFILPITQIEKFKHGIVLRNPYHEVFILYSDIKDLKQYIDSGYIFFGKTFIASPSPLIDEIQFTNLYTSKSVFLTPCQIKELIN